jgi:hypothetical protein
MAQSKKKLNDVRQMDQSKGRNQKGTVGQGTILRSREQEAVEGYNRKGIRKYRRTWITTIYAENEEGRFRVDSSGMRKWRNRWQKDGEIRNKGREQARLRGRSQRNNIGGGTGDDKDTGQRQLNQVMQTKQQVNSVSGNRQTQNMAQGNTCDRAELTQVMRTPTVHGDNRKEEQGKGKRKRGASDQDSCKDTIKARVEHEDKGRGLFAQGRNRGMEGGTGGKGKRKFYKANEESERTEKSDASQGPMDKYLKVKESDTGSQNASVGTTPKLSARIVDPKNPRKRPNRRTRRLHLQLHKIQAQPTLNWYGFKREIEEKQIHSADFAEEITYAMLESLYKVEDFTIIGVKRDNATDIGTQDWLKESEL